MLSRTLHTASLQRALTALPLKQMATSSFSPMSTAIVLAQATIISHPNDCGSSLGGSLSPPVHSPSSINVTFLKCKLCHASPWCRPCSGSQLLYSPSNLNPLGIPWQSVVRTPHFHC